VAQVSVHHRSTLIFMRAFILDGDEGAINIQLEP
jgi:hypothetical protein